MSNPIIKKIRAQEIEINKQQCRLIPLRSSGKPIKRHNVAVMQPAQELNFPKEGIIIFIKKFDFSYCSNAAILKLGLVRSLLRGVIDNSFKPISCLLYIFVWEAFQKRRRPFNLSSLNNQQNLDMSLTTQSLTYKSCYHTQLRQILLVLNMNHIS